MSVAVEDWHVGEVCSFLREKEVDEEVVALFREARVDGNQFLSLNDDSLKALGLKRAKDRTCIKVLLAELVLINAVIPAPPPGSAPLSYGHCEDHTLPRRPTYCDTCKTLLCDECIVTTHKGHDFSSASDVASMIRESLRERAAALEEISKGVCEKIISECFQSLE